MTIQFAPHSDQARPIWPVWQGADIPAGAAAGDWPALAGFTGRAGQVCLLPDQGGGLAGALVGLGARAKAGRQRFLLEAAKLPPGDWYLADFPEGLDPQQAALGWLLGQYRFDRYKQATTGRRAALVCPPAVDGDRLCAIARGEFLTRDLINTPANDMGPDQLEQAARHLADKLGATLTVISGPDLHKAGLPMIHAVGRASDQAPRLLDLRLGDHGPALCIIGKGVCFDTGGLDIKPPSSMGLMKKDMGGAATALGLLAMLAGTGAAAGRRIRLLIPAVENAISGNAFRPGDVLTSRKGLTVEVNNTDAEGRLVLADALALAAEEAPDLMISLATLTGAARVALGPDIAPFFCDDDAGAEILARAGTEAGDPLWRLPFWEPYEPMIELAIADLDNAPTGGMAGAITAALFLRRFAEGAGRYVHLDIYGWQQSAAPGRPKGGVGQGARAILQALPALLP